MTKPSLRIDPENPDHHLWNNNGTWWIHLTIHRSDHTSERMRRSLRTRDLAAARSLRDTLLQSLNRNLIDS